MDPMLTGNNSRFYAIASLASRRAAGTLALVSGHTPLAVGLLLDEGLVSGTAFAMGMDGGSLAHPLGLRN